MLKIRNYAETVLDEFADAIKQATSDKAEQAVLVAAIAKEISKRLSL